MKQNEALRQGLVNVICKRQLELRHLRRLRRLVERMDSDGFIPPVSVPLQLFCSDGSDASEGRSDA